MANSKSNLKHHIQRKHTEGKSCDLCSFVGSMQGLQEHRRRKHEGYQFSCPACEFKDPSNIALKSHIQEKHDGRGFQCDICEKAFHIKPNLERHVQNVHKREIYSCDQCAYSART